MSAIHDSALFTSDSSSGSSRCYPAKLVRIIDADTLVVDRDAGCELQQTLKVRLLGINAPEMNTDAGKAARDFVVEWFANHGQKMHLVTIKDKSHSDKSDSFGRYLAYVSVGNACLNDELLAAGHAEVRK